MKLLLVLLACTPVQPQQVAAAIVGGDLQGAARLAAEVEGAQAEQALARDALRWPLVEAERAALSRASRELLRDSIEARLAAGDLHGAAAHLAAALQAWPEDPAFLSLAHSLGEAAEDAPPAAAVTAWQALAELLAHRPEQAAAWRARAQQARLADAYGRGLSDTRAAQAGLVGPAAEHLLRRIDHEYVDAPDWAACSRAGRRRLAWLAATDGARVAWPRLADLTWPAVAATDIEGAIADLDAAVAAGAAAGLPAEVVLDEWVSGALGALDPWTRAVWPAEIAAWQAHHAGVSVGVGVELDLVGEQVVVQRPLLDTPAWSGGVHQGDVVAWVQGSARLRPAELPVEERLAAVAQALAGQPGSTVQLGLLRDGAPLSLTLSRAPVNLETVQGLARDEDNRWSPWLDREEGIAYVRITGFREHSEPAFDALLEPISDQIRAVVIDLRGNPGGDINAAVQIADRFVDEGWLARISGRVPPETGPDVDPQTGQPLAEWNQALAGHALEGRVVVVLVDAGTASAAEVLAGSLQELAGATVVGAPTWGKGYAQALRTELELGYAVQLTNLVWALPSGRRLTHQDGGGIAPQLALPAASPGEDFRVSWMVAERTALRVHADGTPMTAVGTPAREDLPPLSTDPVLLAGLLAARARLLPQ